MTPIDIKNNYYVLIVKPNAGCSTKKVYELADTMDLVTYDINNVVIALKEGDDELLAKSIGNALQPAAIKEVPEIQTIIDSLKEKGLKIVLMSGSGSSVIALSTNKKLIKSIAKDYEDKYRVEVTKILK